MPGTPMDQANDGLAKLQTDNLDNGRNEDEDVQQQEYRPEREARELTQTDRLNKRLLESLLERMNKSEGEFDRFMDKEDEEEETEDLDEEGSEF